MLTLVLFSLTVSVCLFGLFCVVILGIVKDIEEYSKRFNESSK